MSHPIDEAAKCIGSQAVLGARLGVTRAAVHQWKISGRQVPIEHCARIEQLTGGVVSRRQLRPVDWHVIWPELVSKRHPAPATA